MMFSCYSKYLSLEFSVFSALFCHLNCLRLLSRHVHAEMLFRQHTICLSFCGLCALLAVYL